MLQEVQEQNIAFDLLKVMKVIEGDKDLDGIFRDGKITQPYSMLYTLIEQEAFPEEMVERAKGIFDHIILDHHLPRLAYTKLFRDELPDVVGPSEAPVQLPSTPTPDTPSEVPAPKYKLPKHFGKLKVLEGITAANETTEVDRALLALNGFRNMYSKLKARCIKDKITGSTNLSDADCKDIVAMLRLMENKLSHITKKTGKKIVKTKK